jgi:hypothetical protein
MDGRLELVFWQPPQKVKDRDTQVAQEGSVSGLKV